MAQLVRQFVCSTCGGTAPLSDRPYQECASCNIVGDYDYGVARVHPEWPKHEDLGMKMFRSSEALQLTFFNRDLEGYAHAYAKILEHLIGACPGLFPSPAADPAYRAKLAQYHGYWQAVTCLEGSLQRLDSKFRRLRGEVVVKKGKAVPATLWPLIDHALEHFSEVQRITDFHVARPDNLAPDYIKRWMISATLSEWLPQLPVKEQRELVDRMGFGNQYLAPGKETVTCRNCAGAIEIEPGFVTIFCPFCAAQIHEGRVNFRDVEMDRWSGSGYDEAFGWVEGEMKAKADRLIVLDGPVMRDNQPARLITLRAGFGKRIANFWRIYDDNDSPKIADVLMWIEQYTTRAKLALEKLPYREHPQCNQKLSDIHEPLDEVLSRRLAESAPGGVPYWAHEGDGNVVEAVVDGTVVRLLFEDEGQWKKVIRRWVAAHAPTSS